MRSVKFILFLVITLDRTDFQLLIHVLSNFPFKRLRTEVNFV